ncbi:MAG: bifunctional phosphoribosylaminoimidazolecarboxamide formyltransferase/IMP cyclohydrolase PurH, partial [Betaproteobacteria bacterium]|nr:bifunctional phosphoribosylaminoimidazolecarboxamide formyltransferase/IMP cyclohydrolase PurH [Betaproteobacteria bacterium]
MLEIRRALVSVSNKQGLAELAQGLVALGVSLISTGGTAAFLRDLGLSVTEVSELTQFPEMLDGRVKTLHPVIHAGLLARKNHPGHHASLVAQGIESIDMLVVNFYPFEQSIARDDCTLDDAIEQIDIGGPAMLRSAAKNWQSVAVLSSPEHYAPVLEAMRLGQLHHDCPGLNDAQRFDLAVSAFERVSQYDAAISNYLSTRRQSAQPEQGGRFPFPRLLMQSLIKQQDLRYGENPHQQAALYREASPAPGSLVTAIQRQGKDLSFNNLADADAAWACVQGFARPSCVIVKHANPCGVASGDSCRDAYTKAFACDPTSAFGGIIAFNHAVDEPTAQALAQQFVEVLIAPGYSAEALTVLAGKANIRVLEIDCSAIQSLDNGLAQAQVQLDIKRISSGFLVQTADQQRLRPEDFSVVSKRMPSTDQLADLCFAWQVAKYVKSNAIVFCRQQQTLGIGAGQMSRLDSARIAAIKSEAASLSLAASVVASDAFFPFRDGLDVVIDAGAQAVIQPGGSLRDNEV